LKVKRKLEWSLLVARETVVYSKFTKKERQAGETTDLGDQQPKKLSCNKIELKRYYFFIISRV